MMISADLHGDAKVVGGFGEKDSDGRNLVDAGISAVELTSQYIAMYFSRGLLAEMASESLALDFVEIVHEGYSIEVGHAVRAAPSLDMQAWRFDVTRQCC